MEVKPVTLDGDRVRMEPMTIEHLDSLAMAGGFDELWRWTAVNASKRDDMKSYVEAALADAAKGVALPARTALYSAMPYDYAYPGSCTNGSPSPNSDPGADGEVSVLAHEIEETTTDMMGNACFDSVATRMPTSAPGPGGRTTAPGTSRSAERTSLCSRTGRT